MNQQTKDLISNEIANNEICLFMKGTPDAPQCGFSMAIANMFKILEVDFKGINVLENQSLREGIKEFSDWFSRTLIPLKFTSKIFNIFEIAIENPHCGASGVPFINKQTSLFVISLLIKSFVCCSIISPWFLLLKHAVHYPFFL